LYVEVSSFFLFAKPESQMTKLKSSLPPLFSLSCVSFPGGFGRLGHGDDALQATPKRVDALALEHVKCKQVSALGDRSFSSLSALARRGLKPANGSKVQQRTGRARVSRLTPVSSFFVCFRTPCDPSPVLSLPVRLPVALPTPRRSPRRGKSTRGGRGKMAAWALGMSWTRCDQVGRKQTRERGLRGFFLG
jgi:hypothetical protein